MTFAVQLRRGRQSLGVTQSSLAALLRTTPARISLWERGKCLPRLEHLPVVAKVLRMTLEFQLYGVVFTVSTPDAAVVAMHDEPSGVDDEVVSDDEP